MSADLYLIALPTDGATLERYRRLQMTSWTGDDDPEDEDEYRDDEGFLRNRRMDAYTQANGLEPDRGLTWNEYNALREQVGLHEGPHVWIGQVSWLKAVLLGDEGWVPSSVGEISRLYADLPVLTPGLAKATMVAMNLPNRSHYGHRHYRRVGRRIVSERSRGLAKRQNVKKWLEVNMGKRVVAESR